MSEAAMMEIQRILAPGCGSPKVKAQRQAAP